MRTFAACRLPVALSEQASEFGGGGRGSGRRFRERSFLYAFEGSFACNHRFLRPRRNLAEISRKAFLSISKYKVQWAVGAKRAVTFHGTGDERETAETMTMGEVAGEGRRRAGRAFSFAAIHRTTSCASSDGSRNTTSPRTSNNKTTNNNENKPSLSRCPSA